jgi:STE24 endopeptidase
MNIYAAIILFTLGADYILSITATLLNFKTLGKDLPAEFSGIYEREEYARSQAYTKTRMLFSTVTGFFGLALVLIFWFCRGFNVLDVWIRPWGLHPIWNGLIFIGILILGRTLLTLPFGIYETFVIEERFGFNRTRPVTFVTDLIKSLILSVVLGGPLLAGVLALFLYGGRWVWIAAWAAVAVFSLLIQFIAPRWILPLFNKFKPLPEGSLRKKILDYANSVNYRVSGVFLMDGSRRSSKSNAFFTGFGRNKRIALYDTLLDKHSEEEVVTVLAHEIGHYKKKHVLKGMVLSLVHLGILFFLLSLFISNRGLFDAFYMENLSMYAGLVFFGLLYSPIELVLSPLLNALSRKHEVEADAFAVQTTNAPDHFISALKNLSRDNLTHLLPHPFYVFLHYSHPPVLQRIRKIRLMRES